MWQFSQGFYEDEPPFHRLLQRHLQHRMDAPHEGVGQGFVVLFRPAGHPAVFFQALYILWMWMDDSCLSLLAPMTGMMCGAR